MPDIQMCHGAQTEQDAVVICQVRDECYRHTAKPSPLQVWGPPGDGFNPEEGCDEYIPRTVDNVTRL